MGGCWFVGGRRFTPTCLRQHLVGSCPAVAHACVCALLPPLPPCLTHIAFGSPALPATVSSPLAHTTPPPAYLSSPCRIVAGSSYALHFPLPLPTPYSQFCCVPALFLCAACPMLPGGPVCHLTFNLLLTPGRSPYHLPTTTITPTSTTTFRGHCPLTIFPSFPFHRTGDTVPRFDWTLPRWLIPFIPAYIISTPQALSLVCFFFSCVDVMFGWVWLYVWSFV